MITIYSSDSMGVRGNCLYPYRHEVTDTAGLREAVRHDYVCACLLYTSDAADE